MSRVLKPFNTARQRFAAGGTVSEADDLSPHTFDGLQALGFIEAPAEPEQPARRAHRAKDTPED